MSEFLNWVPSDLESCDDWILRLGDSVVNEIIGLARKNAHRSTDLLSLGREHFPLSPESLGRFRQAVEATQQGYGACLIKGFPARQLSEDEFRVAAWGVGLHLGVARPQNMAGDIVTDVRDSGSADYRVLNGRGYNTRSELDFHIDSGDVVFLFCRREARSGGQSLVANPFSIAEYLCAKDPKYEGFLRYEYPFSLGGYRVDGREFYFSPLLDGDGDAAAFRINIKNIRNGAVQAGVELPEDYLNFLHEFQELAGSPRFCYRMHLEEGDIQILNNFRTIHSRTAFEDHESADEKRHLLRLWLCLKDSQPLPKSWLPSFGRIEPGTVRGGFRNIDLDSRFENYVRSQCRELGIAY